MFGAAFAAGAINSIAGGGTLLTFPVLIWLGLDAKVANGTSTVALWPGLFGGLYGYRRELENSSPILIRLGLTSIVGGAVGAWLLIFTPSKVFAQQVPFLILFATLLFMSHPVLSRRLHLGSLENKPTKLWWTGAMVFQFFSAMYGGYFGAGNGILMLAALGLLGLRQRDKEFSRHLYQQYRGPEFCSCGARGLAGCTRDGVRRARRWLFWRAHGGTRGPGVGT
jgi:uncharacterized protein